MLFRSQADFNFICPGTIVQSQTPPSTRTLPDSVSQLSRTVAVHVPRARVTELHVNARLMYRKADQFLINFLFGKESGITAPVTVMSEDRKTIHVTRGSE